MIGTGTMFGVVRSFSATPGPVGEHVTRRQSGAWAGSSAAWGRAGVLADADLRELLREEAAAVECTEREAG